MKESQLLPCGKWLIGNTILNLTYLEFIHNFYLNSSFDELPFL
jgi:hypothetical protein